MGYIICKARKNFLLIFPKKKDFPYGEKKIGTLKCWLVKRTLACFFSCPEKYKLYFGMTCQKISHKFFLEGVSKKTFQEAICVFFIRKKVRKSLNVGTSCLDTLSCIESFSELQRDWKTWRLKTYFGTYHKNHAVCSSKTILNSTIVDSFKNRMFCLNLPARHSHSSYRL